MEYWMIQYFNSSTHDLTKRSTAFGYSIEFANSSSTHDLTKRSTALTELFNDQYISSTHDLTKRSTFPSVSQK